MASRASPAPPGEVSRAALTTETASAHGPAIVRRAGGDQAGPGQAREAAERQGCQQHGRAWAQGQGPEAKEGHPGESPRSPSSRCSLDCSLTQGYELQCARAGLEHRQPNTLPERGRGRPPAGALRVLPVERQLLIQPRGLLTRCPSVVSPRCATTASAHPKAPDPPQNCPVTAAITHLSLASMPCTFCTSRGEKKCF